MAKTQTIPLSVPHIFGKEWRYVKRCIDTGWVSTAGQYVNELEKKIAALTQAKYAVACSSGTVALQVALEIVGVKKGDEVIVPTVTFIAPVNAVRYCGAEPIFMDADEYFNIDVDKVLAFLKNNTVQKNGRCFNKKTKKVISAVIPVHIFGNAADLYRLIPECKKRNIKVVEDATESLGTVYKTGKHTGTLGEMGCYSFNGNKIITAGGGGMIVTNNSSYAYQAMYLTTQAKDDGLYYIHNNVGYNYRLNNLQAAMGVAQLECLGKVLKRKAANFDLYKKEVKKIKGLWIPQRPAYARNNNWMYPLCIDEKIYGRTRDELLTLFKQESIEVRPLWQLNHLQKPYRGNEVYKIIHAPELLEVTLNLPCSYGLTKEQIYRVVGLLKKWQR